MTAEPRDVEEIRARLAAADRENAELRNSLEACRNAGESIRTELDDARELNHGLTSRLLSAGNEKGRLQRENAELRGEVERLTKEPRDAFTDRVRLQADINKGMLAACEQALTAMNRTLATVEAERNSARAQLAAAQAQLAEARAWVAKTEPYPDLNGNKLAGLRAALSAAPQPEPDECGNCGDPYPGEHLIDSEGITCPRHTATGSTMVIHDGFIGQCDLCAVHPDGPR